MAPLAESECLMDLHSIILQKNVQSVKFVQKLPEQIAKFIQND